MPVHIESIVWMCVLCVPVNMKKYFCVGEPLKCDEMRLKMRQLQY